VVERSGYRDGEPCWADVTVPDVETGKRFYGDVLGWTFSDSAAEFGGYVNCFKDGRTVAGMSPPQPGNEGMPPVWSVYLWSDDADATARRIEQHGGKLLAGPVDIPGQGRMVFAFDPGGAAFGVWQPQSHHGAQLYAEPGALSWAEIHTHEPAQVDTFYLGLFGYRQEQIGQPPAFDYATYRVGGETVCGRLKMGPEFGAAPSYWVAYFGVDDCDSAVGRVTAAGGRVDVPPFDSPYGRIAIIADPGGAKFCLVHMTTTSAPPGS
jgi:predicted enzyme related to lactoylglutathione lyase